MARRSRWRRPRGQIELAGPGEIGRTGHGRIGADVHGHGFVQGRRRRPSAREVQRDGSAAVIAADADRQAVEVEGGLGVGRGARGRRVANRRRAGPARPGVSLGPGGPCAARRESWPRIQGERVRFLTPPLASFDGPTEPRRSCGVSTLPWASLLLVTALSRSCWRPTLSGQGDRGVRDPAERKEDGHRGHNVRVAQSRSDRSLHPATARSIHPTEFAASR